MKKFFLLFAVSFVVGSFSLHAMDDESDENSSKTKSLTNTSNSGPGQTESFPDFHWKKVTSSRNDLFVLWELNQELVEGDKDYIKYITLTKPLKFDDFYNEVIKKQSIPNQQTMYLELNPLSGVYLFYLSEQEPKPIGFLKIDAALECNWVEGCVAVKAGSPKGIGTKALQVLTNLFEPYCGRELMFCTKHEAEDENQPTYAFEKGIVDHVAGGIEYTNIASLIVNTRVGMEPFHPVRSDAIKGKNGAYLAYPPLDHAEFAKKFPDCYVNQIEPHKEAMKRLSEILKEVSSRDLSIREKGLKALKVFEKDQTPKSDCTIL